MRFALIGYGAMGKLIRSLTEAKGHMIAAVVDETDAVGLQRATQRFVVQHAAIYEVAVRLRRLTGVRTTHPRTARNNAGGPTEIDERLESELVGGVLLLGGDGVP